MGSNTKVKGNGNGKGWKGDGNSYGNGNGAVNVKALPSPFKALKSGVQKVWFKLMNPLRWVKRVMGKAVMLFQNQKQINRR